MIRWSFSVTESVFVGICCNFGFVMICLTSVIEKTSNLPRFDPCNGPFSVGAVLLVLYVYVSSTE